MIEIVNVGGIAREVYRDENEIIITGYMRMQVKEAKDLAAALLKVADRV